MFSAAARRSSCFFSASGVVHLLSLAAKRSLSVHGLDSITSLSARYTTAAASSVFPAVAVVRPHKLRNLAVAQLAEPVRARLRVIRLRARHVVQVRRGVNWLSVHAQREGQLRRPVRDGGAVAYDALRRPPPRAAASGTARRPAPGEAGRLSAPARRR